MCMWSFVEPGNKQDELAAFASKVPFLLPPALDAVTSGLMPCG